MEKIAGPSPGKPLKYGIGICGIDIAACPVKEDEAWIREYIRQPRGPWPWS